MKKNNILFTFLAFLGLNTFVFAQGPSITSFSPLSGAVSTAVTITGTGFSTTPADNIVYFGAVKAIVNTATAGSLTVLVPVGATYDYITVITNSLAGASGEKFTPSTGAGGTIDAGTFNVPTDHYTLSKTNNIAVGDMNNDGLPDICISGNDPTAQFSTLINMSVSASLSFSEKLFLPTELNAQGIQLADLDGDGLLDAVIANYDANKISIYKNTTVGDRIAYALPQTYTAGSGPFRLAIGDLNADGKADIVVSNSGSNTISVFKNTSTGGSISFAAKLDFITATNPKDIAMGDFDKDGLPDLAVINYNANSVSLFKNTSTSGIAFASKVDIATSALPRSIGIADMDKDAKLDLVIAHENGIDIFSNQIANSTAGISISSFALEVSYVTSANTVAITLGDIDGDSRADVVTSTGSGLINLFKNTSTIANIQLEEFIGIAGTNVGFPFIADLNADGKPELGITHINDNDISIYKNIFNGGGDVSGETFEIYAVLKKKVDGGFYLPIADKMKFKFEGEYAQENINYAVYDLSTGLATSIPINNLVKNYGDNRFELDLAAVLAPENKYYTLEVKNEKKVAYYLRFKY